MRSKATKTFSQPTRTIRWRGAYARSSRLGARRLPGGAPEAPTRRRPIGHISDATRVARIPTTREGVWRIYRLRWSRRPASRSSITTCHRRRPMKSFMSTGRSWCLPIPSSASRRRRLRRSYSFRRLRFTSSICRRLHRQRSLSCCRSPSIGRYRCGWRRRRRSSRLQATSSTTTSTTRSSSTTRPIWSRSPTRKAKPKRLHRPLPPRHRLHRLHLDCLRRTRRRRPRHHRAPASPLRLVQPGLLPFLHPPCHRPSRQRRPSLPILNPLRRPNRWLRAGSSARNKYRHRRLRQLPPARRPPCLQLLRQRALNQAHPPRLRPRLRLLRRRARKHRHLLLVRRLAGRRPAQASKSDSRCRRRQAPRRQARPRRAGRRPSRVHRQAPPATCRHSRHRLRRRSKHSRHRHPRPGSRPERRRPTRASKSGSRCPVRPEVSRCRRRRSRQAPRRQARPRRAGRRLS
jgi:hypothetical protein